MKILVINTGSSSIKYKLFDMENKCVLVSGNAEKIGESNSLLTHEVFASGKTKERRMIEKVLSDHHEGLLLIADILINQNNGIIKERKDIDAIGHRVVHGGEAFHKPTIIDNEVLESIKANISLAPLHNPPNLTGIKAALNIFPHAPQVAVFDTAFHQTIPQKAYLYAIPMKFYHEQRIRKYGFHGTSHSYVAEQYAKYTNTSLRELNLITIHLGNGSSIAAIKKGVCVDTSMGFTPLEGLVMGTRSGDLDPSIPFFMSRHYHMSLSDVDMILNKESGLKGLCGTNDMREVIAKVKAGDKQALLALDVYIYRIKRYIGAYIAILGDLNGIVFTAGIGERSPEVRELVCDDLHGLGIILDPEKNILDSKDIRDIGAKESKVRLLVIPTDEELKIAQETFKVVSGRDF